MYEVVGTISERSSAKTTNRAGLDVLTAIVLIVALSPSVMSVTRAWSRRAPTPARSSIVAANVRPEPTENSAAPSYSPPSAPAAPPAHPDARGEIKGMVTYEGALPKFKPLNMVNEPTCAKHYMTPVFPENVVAGSNDGLSNVVVYISAGGEEGPAPAQPAMLKQRGCR